MFRATWPPGVCREGPPHQEAALAFRGHPAPGAARAEAVDWGHRVSGCDRGRPGLDDRFPARNRPGWCWCPPDPRRGWGADHFNHRLSV